MSDWGSKAWLGLTGAAMIVGLGSLKNGQPFPPGMFVVYALLLVGLVLMFVLYLVLRIGRRVLAIGTGHQPRYANSPIESLEPYAAALAGVGVFALGISIVVSAQPTRPATPQTFTVAEIGWEYNGGEGPNHYNLLACPGAAARCEWPFPDSVTYVLDPDDFSPTLPAGLASQPLKGQTAVLTLDEGTTKVLAMELNGIYYETAELTDRSWWPRRNWIYGSIIALVGGVALAVRWGPWSWRRQSRGEEPEEVKIKILVKALRDYVAKERTIKPYPLSIGERAEATAAAFRHRQISTQEALEQLMLLAHEVDEAEKARESTGLNPEAAIARSSGDSANDPR